MRAGTAGEMTRKSLNDEDEATEVAVEVIGAEEMPQKTDSDGVNGVKKGEDQAHASSIDSPFLDKTP